jgi:hypothetical protein
MKDYAGVPFGEVQREYLASCTSAMPIAGLIAWTALALAALMLGDGLPTFAPFVAAAIPFPLAIIIDKLRGEPSIFRPEGRDNPIGQLFMRFITVVALLIPFVIFAAQASKDLNLLILGLAIFSGLMWVPHGWGANDAAGFVHFVLRAALCYAAFVFAPQEFRGAAIAAVAASTYIYAIAAMKKPASVR